MSTIGAGVDIYRNNEARVHLEPWARLADRINGVVIGVVHLTKAPKGDVVAAINASSAFGEVARSVIGFAKDQQSGERVMSQAKNSTGPEDLSLSYEIESMNVTTDSGRLAEVGKFSILGYSERTVSDLLSGPRLQQGPSAADRAAEWLEGYLIEHGRTRSAEVKDAAREDGHSERAIARAVRELEVKVEREGYPAITYWSLPADSAVTPTNSLGATGATESGTAPRAYTTANTTSNNSNPAPVRPVRPAEENGATVGATGATGDAQEPENVGPRQHENEGEKDARHDQKVARSRDDFDQLRAQLLGDKREDAKPTPDPPEGRPEKPTTQGASVVATARRPGLLTAWVSATSAGSTPR